MIPGELRSSPLRERGDRLEVISAHEGDRLHRQGGLVDAVDPLLELLVDESLVEPDRERGALGKTAGFS